MTAIAVSGLTNGASYTFSVKATNTIGNSLASSASSAVTPASAANTPVTLTANQAWTPQQVYDWNSNWSNVAYTPAGGSCGAQAISFSGVSYRWKHYNNVWPVDISIAKPSSANLAARVSAAQSCGTTASWGVGVNGYFAVNGAQGIAQVFRNGYWIVIADEMSGSSADITQIVTDVVSNLP